MGDATRRPTAATLVDLAVDDWSRLLAVALPVVRDLPDRLQDPTTRRLAALPPSRLVAGRSRRDLASVLTRPDVWDLVDAVLPEGDRQRWVAADTGDAAEDDTGVDEQQVARLRDQLAALRERERRLVETVTELREDVGRLRRSRDGATARAEVAEEAVAAARDELAAARRAVTAAEDDAEAARDRASRETARARRREDAELVELRDELRAARRERDEFRQDRDRLAGQLEAARARERDGSATGTDAPASAPGGGTRGRPSTLPEGMAPGTRDAAAWLVGGGSVLLVDGYNVTRQHRPDLALPEQRRWLEDAVAALAGRRQVDATVVWDGSRGRPTTRRGRRGVTVRFTADGVTADDQLVLHVQLAVEPDRPVVVVTDDAELRTRLAEHGVDLLDSTSFTWLL